LLSSLGLTCGVRILLWARQMYLQVGRLCQGCWRFSGIAVSPAAWRRQALAAVLESFVFYVAHNVPNLYIRIPFLLHESNQVLSATLG
jgi:hypothetical protein